MPTLRHLTQGAQCKLYHQRLGHPGERAMKTIHLHVDGIPKLKANAFYKCASCLHAKMKQRAFNHTQSGTPSRTITADEDKVECGQSFNVDYGFMKGSGYCSKDEEGRTITSGDGYRAYCLIVDRSSRYTWLFLTKTKTPPLKILTTFLAEHGNKQARPRTIRTDQGGELWASQVFRETIQEAGYLVEPTEAGAMEWQRDRTKP